MKDRPNLPTLNLLKTRKVPILHPMMRPKPTEKSSSPTWLHFPNAMISMPCQRWLDRQVPCHPHALSLNFAVLVGKGSGDVNTNSIHIFMMSVDLVNYASSFCQMTIERHWMLKDDMSVSCLQRVVVVEPVPSSHGPSMISRPDCVECVIPTVIAFYTTANHPNEVDEDSQPRTFPVTTNLAAKIQEFSKESYSKRVSRSYMILDSRVSSFHFSKESCGCRRLVLDESK
jgi:hypothetical protein